MVIVGINTVRMIKTRMQFRHLKKPHTPWSPLCPCVTDWLAQLFLFASTYLSGATDCHSPPQLPVHPSETRRGLSCLVCHLSLFEQSFSCRPALRPEHRPPLGQHPAFTHLAMGGVGPAAADLRGGCRHKGSACNCGVLNYSGKRPWRV